MNSVTRLYLRSWRPAVLVASLGLIAYLLYFSRLSSLLPGYSTTEVTAYTSASSWNTIAHFPTNAPYTVLLNIAVRLLHNDLLTTRIVSASIGIITVFLFYMVIRHWYTFRIAFLGTLVFATSAGLLHIARLGTGQILQMGTLLILALLLSYHRRPNRRTLLGYIGAALFAMLWYVPGMLWFEIAGLFMLQSDVRYQLKSIPTLHLAGWGIIFILFICPLVAASVSHPHTLLLTTGLPQTMHAFEHIPGHLLDTVMSISVRSTGNPLVWVGHAPLLDIIEFILGVIGVYNYFGIKRTSRGLLLGLSLVMSIVLISFDGSVTTACMVPLLYLFIADGLSQLLGQWLIVFPRNPIARITGISLICIMLFFSITYQVRAYFIAWPHNSETRQTFSHQLHD